MIFEFNGGADKSGQGTHKFYLFAVMDGNESILFDALKRGIVQRSDKHRGYFSHTPYLKIFTSSQGFGFPRAYYSFFFKLDEDSNKMITIKPINLTPGYYFKARGNFMTKEEITSVCSEDTLAFYRRQTYLSKAQIKAMVATEFCEQSGAPIKVRKLIV